MINTIDEFVQNFVEEISKQFPDNTFVQAHDNAKGELSIGISKNENDDPYQIQIRYLADSSFQKFGPIDMGLLVKQTLEEYKTLQDQNNVITNLFGHEKYKMPPAIGVAYG